MQTNNFTMAKRNVSLFLVMCALLVLSSACGSSATEPIRTTSPVPPMISQTPDLSTLSPTPVPPTASLTSIPPTSTRISIPGIDEPIIIENVTVKGFVGSQKIDIKLRLLEAYTKDSSGNNTPSDPDNIFLILEYWLYGNQTGDSEWVAANAILTCGSDEFKVDRSGIIVGDDSRLKAHTLTFEVPEDSDMKQCAIKLNEHVLDLTSFFE